MSCFIIPDGQYVFDASAKTVTIKDMVVPHENVKMISNVNQTNKASLYTGIGTGKGGTRTISGNDTIITLEYDTTLMSDTDKLVISIFVPPREKVFQYLIPPNSNLPSGALPTIDPILNTEPNTVDSGWFYVGKNKSGLHTVIEADQACEVYILNAADNQGAKARDTSNPFLITVANQVASLPAPFYDDFARIIFVNNSGSAVTDLSIYLEAREQQFNGIWLQIKQKVFSFFNALLTQSVLLGEDDQVPDTFNRVHTHNDGTYSSLSVHRGAPAAEASGSVRHEVRLVAGTSSQEISGSWGNSPITGNPYKFYCESMLWQGRNISTLSDLSAYVREVNITGNTKIPIRIEEAITGTGGVSKVNGSSWSNTEDPILFDTAVYFELVAGAGDIDVNLYGYLK